MKIDCMSFDKIFYHPEHLKAVLDGRSAFPLHLELGPVNYCNHNCTFCYASRSMFKRLGVPPTQIETKRLVEVIKEMAGNGLKSVTLAGSGEPTLHKDFNLMLHSIKEAGVEIGLFTNGSKLHQDDVLEAILSCCTFARFSFTGAAKVHKIVHGVNTYREILSGIERCAAARSATLPTLGLQYVLADYSASELQEAARAAKEAGVDYFQVKPTFIADGKTDQLPNRLAWEEADSLVQKLMELEDDHFKIHYKPDQIKGAILNVDDRVYNCCDGCTTVTVLESDFEVYLCANQKVKEYSLGNVREKAFSDIWMGQKHLDILKSLNVHRCLPHCRNHPLNVLYHELRTGVRKIPETLPEPAAKDHINFL